MTFWQRIKIWILDTFTEPVEGSGSISRSTHKETGKAEIILNNNNSLAGTDKTDWRYWSRFTAIILAITILWQGATVYAFNEWASRYVNVKPVEVVHKPNEQWQERTISYNLSKVKHAGVSFNGEYLVWSENNNFTVWDLANDQPLYYEKMVKGESVAHVQWLEDRNRLLLIVERSVSPISLPAPPRTNNQTQTPAVEQSERNTQSVEASEVSTPQTASRGRAEEFASRGRLDSLVQSMNKIEAGSVSTQNFIKKFDIYFLNADGRQRIFSTHISGLSKEAIVQQAAVVTQSNLLYVVVGDQGFANNLYRVDVQHDALKVPQNARSRVETLMVGGIKGAFAEIWDTANDKQPQLYGLKGLQLASAAIGNSKQLLLGFDQKDAAYLGIGDKESIKEVISWDGKQTRAERQLSPAIPRSMIRIGDKGEFIVVDPTSGNLKLYPRDNETPFLFSFEKDASIINSKRGRVGLLKAAEHQSKFWYLDLR